MFRQVKSLNTLFKLLSLSPSNYACARRTAQFVQYISCYVPLRDINVNIINKITPNTCKMAKKGQAVQLQQELSSDEDWDKMLQREGLIVVDIYSEWCGPCSAMIANLKKLKLEVGGDNLNLAVAKSDTISYLERFRNKSEPTWMFIVNGKMTNLMFGANAPKLVRLIIQELQNEAEAKNGNRERTFIEISDLAPDEQVRYDAAKELEDEAIRIEVEKAAQVLRDKRLAVANVVLDHYANAGVVLVFPQAAKQGQSTLAEFWGPAGLTVAVTEKTQVTEEMIDEMLYFADREKEFTKTDAYNLTNAPSMAYLIKPHNADDYHNDIDNAVLEIVYGSERCPPGSPDSPAQRLFSSPTKTEMMARLFGSSKASLQSKIAMAPKKKPGEEEEKKDEDEIVELSGLWAPPNAYTKATAIKLLFPKQYDPIALPQRAPVPPHVAIVFEAFKRREVLDLINEYRSDIIRFGFFSDDNPQNTKLIAKTLPLFEKAIAAGTTFGEKLVVQLAKTRPEPLKAFMDHGPTFVSKNSVEGEHECKAFFPEDYDEPEGGPIVEIKKKKKRGKKAKEATVASQEALIEGEHGTTDEAAANEEEAEGDHAEGEGESEGEGEGDGELQIDEENAGDNEEALPEGADKATSPMPP